jgi:two-component system sensor histidine kinase/response regulator
MATILIVDDNKKNLQVLGSVLHENMYKVAMAKDGPSALRLVKKNNPDLILLDIMMPEMDGFEVCERLKEDPETREIPIIFLTAKTEVEDIVRGFSLGGVDYITKPFKKEELMVRIKTHVDLVRSKRMIENQAKELRAANSMKDKIFSVIAHDLRDALGSFKEFGNTMCDPRIQLSPEDLEEFFHYLKEKASATFDLLENLLWWSRSQRQMLHPKLKRFSLKKTIDESVESFSEQLQQKQIILENNVGEDVHVIADVEHTQTIVKNLLSNAIKFSNIDNKVIVDVVEGEGMANISFKDEGVGVAEEHVDDLFDEYNHYSTFGTNGEKGSGIGLSLCKELVRLNHGGITVDSKVNEGSVFTVSLPNNI